MKAILVAITALLLAAGPAGAQAKTGARAQMRGHRQTVHATSSHTWSPASSHVSQGTRVTWKNRTGITHTVTAYGGGWSKNTHLSSGSHTSETFNNSGTFKFRCRIHSTLSNGVCSGMCGKIVVH